MTREEAAANAMHKHHWGDTLEGRSVESKQLYVGRAIVTLTAADAYDAAHGVHRLIINDATVERISEILLQNFDWCECRRSPFDKHDVNPPCSTRVRARDSARAMLLAAVEGQ